MNKQTLFKKTRMTNNNTVNKNFSTWNDVAANNQRNTPEK